MVTRMVTIGDSLAHKRDVLVMIAGLLAYPGQYFVTGLAVKR